MIKEYCELTKNEQSKRTTLKQSGRYSLVHGSGGYEPAGSCARYTDEYWSVESYIDGARHGRRFSTPEKAIELFNKWI